MEFLSVLWLPILLSGVLVFIVSSIIHMVFKYHNSDYKSLPGEDQILSSLHENGVEPGMYSFPHCTDMKQMCEPDMVAKCEKGPVGFMLVGPSGAPAMGKPLTFWFLYTLLVGVFVAYLAYFAMGRGGEYMDVFRFTSTTAFIAYGLGYITNGIWMHVPWNSVWKHIFDALIFGLCTAGVFAWLWPEL
jgi:hypothetical protein